MASVTSVTIDDDGLVFNGPGGREREQHWTHLTNDALILGNRSETNEQSGQGARHGAARRGAGLGWPPYPTAVSSPERMLPFPIIEELKVGAKCPKVAHLKPVYQFPLSD